MSSCHSSMPDKTTCAAQPGLGTMTKGEKKPYSSRFLERLRRSFLVGCLWCCTMCVSKDISLHPTVLCCTLSTFLCVSFSFCKKKMEEKENFLLIFQKGERSHRNPESLYLWKLFFMRNVFLTHHMLPSLIVQACSFSLQKVLYSTV